MYSEAQKGRVAVEPLQALEHKVGQLVELIKKLQHDKQQLVQENSDLKEKLSCLENSLLQGSQNLATLNQEKELTKVVVDDLLESIDKLMASESL